MSDYCNYCKSDISLIDSIKLIERIERISVKKKEHIKEESGLICATCIDIYYSEEDKTKLS